MDADFFGVLVFEAERVMIKGAFGIGGRRRIFEIGDQFLAASGIAGDRIDGRREISRRPPYLYVCHERR